MVDALPFAEIRNAHGERIDFAFHAAAPDPAASTGAFPPVVVLAHGVTSHKDRPWLTALAEGLAQAGVAALRISFAGNGASEGRYEEATLTKEVADLGSVLDTLALAGFHRIAFAGHSMGAAVGLLTAARDRRIRALVSLAGMFHVARFFTTQFGHLAFGAPMLDKPGCPWTRALAENAARLGSLTAPAAAITVPWLLVHGTADELVPYQDALDARTAAGGRPEVVAIDGADHRFTGALPVLVGAVVPWLLRAFGGVTRPDPRSRPPSPPPS